MTEKKKPGRPDTYKVEYEEKARKMSLLGLTDVQMAGVFGVSEATFSNWKKKRPELLEAVSKGRDSNDTEIAMSLYNRAKGYNHAET